MVSQDIAVKQRGGGGLLDSFSRQMVEEIDWFLIHRESTQKLVLIPLIP